jgi:hypothetical protein
MMTILGGGYKTMMWDFLPMDEGAYTDAWQAKSYI